MVRKNHRTALAAILIAALAVTLAAPAQADPPPWAPAHGWRKKQGQQAGNDYRVPYDIDRGRCDRESLGTTLGDAVRTGSNSTAGNIGGAIVDVLIRGAAGRSMDRVDQNCVGQSLEYAQDNQIITWKGAGDYTIRPGKTWKTAQNLYCRDYQAIAVTGGRRQQEFGKACRDANGVWRPAS